MCIKLWCEHKPKQIFNLYSIPTHICGFRVITEKQNGHIAIILNLLLKNSHRKK